MPREFLDDVLTQFARVTKIIVDSSQVKEDLENSRNDADLKQVLERTKSQVDALEENAKSLKALFYKQYETMSKTLDEVTITNGSLSDWDEQTEQKPHPSIKLVDISKLVEPRNAKNNNNCVKDNFRPAYNHNHAGNTSVVVISSSEDERPNNKRVLPQRKASVSKRLDQFKRSGRFKSSRSSLKPNNKKSDSDTDGTVVQKKNTVNRGRTRKKDLMEIVLSSDSDVTDIRRGNKAKKTKINSASVEDTQSDNLNLANIDVNSDAKFNSECYVNVLKVPCEKLKEYYLEKLELFETKKLLDLKPLKRSRTRGNKVDASKNKVDGSDDEKQLSSSGSENPREKKKSKKQGDSDKEKNKEKIKKTKSNDQKTEDKGSDTDVETEGLLSENNAETMEDDSDVVLAQVEKYKNCKETETDLILNEVTGSFAEEKNDETPEGLDASESERETGDKEKDVNGQEPSDEPDKDPPETPTDENSPEKEPEAPDGDKLEKSDKKDDEEGGSKETDKTTKKEKDEKKGTSYSSWKKDKMLTVQLSSSDTEEEVKTSKKKKKKEDSQKSSDSDDAINIVKCRKKDRKGKKRTRKAVVIDSDSGSEASSASKSDSGDQFKPSSTSSESESDKKNSGSEEERPKKKGERKRIKRVQDSSDDDDEKSTRKQIRGILSRDSLAASTKKAEAEEKERKARISEKQKKYNQVYESTDLELNSQVEKVVLDYDEKKNKDLLHVDKVLVSKLKPHQASGIQFMWDACFESLERAKSTTGSGCILAHCMGLGKTLQVIALAHTLLTNYDKTKVKKVLVVCPLNTVLNWVNEFKQWLPDNEDYEVYELVSHKQNHARQFQVKTWHECGGVLILGYDMFRTLSNPVNKRFSRKMTEVFQTGLVDPGPDLVICDEGHLLKNEKTNISIAMNRLRTLRRIVLTGTPLQNNLKEYFCMVQFIKPNLLGTYKEYLNRFVNPITNGQYTDSTLHDISIMRKRSHVLHKMLDGVVQRRDYSVLQPYLPPKHEYILFLNLTEVQIKLYRHYMDEFARRATTDAGRTSFLFVDFQNLQRICTHPRVLLDKSLEERNARFTKDCDDEEDSEGSLKDFIDDDDDSSSKGSNDGSGSDDDEDHDDKDKKKKEHKSQKKRVTRAALASAKENGEVLDLSTEVENLQKEWWQDHCDGEELDVIAHSSKIYLLLEILKACEEIGDKVLVFSQSLYSLNIIEYFLEKINDATECGNPESVGGYSGSWCRGLDYFRLDGSTSCDNRSAQCKIFNNKKNTRARLFLISTKAGGLGINLVAANRVIIFDVSWNPSHDVQSIYRVYRFGQTKPCYIYRFVTNGTMEMKIYERQVTKQAISKRVIDEQQIDRHYNQHDLQELYKFDPSTDDRPTPLVPKDVLLGELLQKEERRIYKYHEHQSLLENKEDEGLDEEERKLAWEEFENEKQQRNTLGMTNFLSSNNVAAAIMSLIKKENPAISDHQLRQLLPGVHLQFQVQLSKGDLSMYHRVQQELQLLAAMQAQRFKEQYRAMSLMQQEQFLSMQNNRQQNLYTGMPGTSGNRNNVRTQNPNEVINLDLTD